MQISIWRGVVWRQRYESGKGGSNDTYAIHVQLFFSGDFHCEVISELLPVLESTKQLLWILYILHIQTQKARGSYLSYALQFNMQGVTEKVFEISFSFCFHCLLNCSYGHLEGFLGEVCLNMRRFFGPSLRSKTVSLCRYLLLLDVRMLNLL